MGIDTVYNLLINFSGNTHEIVNIDPHRYCYLELFSEVCEGALSHVSTQTGLTMNLYWIAKGSNEKMLLGGDSDLLKMFESHAPFSNIDLYLEVDDSGVPLPVSSNIVVEIESENEGDVNVEDDNEFDGEEDHFSFSSNDKSDNEWSIVADGNVADENVGDDIVELEPESPDDDCQDGFSDIDTNESSQYSDSSEDSEKEETIIVHKYLKGKSFKYGEKGEIVFEKDLLFDDVHHFRRVLKEYSVQKGFKLVRDKNEKNRVTAHCGNHGCNWRIHASPLPDKVTYKLRTLGENHTCVRTTRNKEVTSTWIAEKLANKFKSQPDINLDVLHAEVKEKFNVDVNYMKLYRARKMALERNEGSHGLSYQKLPMYVHEIMKTNPGSMVRIKRNQIKPEMFKSIFVSFAAMHIGFVSGCRPYIGLDGCHLKGPYGGVLLSAVGLDGNNGLYPIAVSVSDKETRESWCEFLQNLHNIIGAEYRSIPWTFMSDGQKGILQALAEVFPNAITRRCCRHIFNNYKNKFPGLKYRRNFWLAAKSYTEMEFKEHMQVIAHHSQAAHDWLLDHPLETWCRHKFDSRVKCDYITNNHVESFNSWLGSIRLKPVVAVLDSIRTKLMTRVQKRYQKGAVWNGTIIPIVRTKLNNIISKAGSCTLIWAGGEEYEVMEGGMSFVVNLKEHTCCCRMWELNGLPCHHAAACISYNRLDIEGFCDTYFYKDMYMKAYESMIHPIRHESMWSEINGIPLYPPRLVRQPGRPKRVRRREVDEPAAGKRSCVVRCSICKCLGHNKRGCQRAPTARARARARHATTSITRERAGAAGPQEGSSSQARARSVAGSSSQISAQSSVTRDVVGSGSGRN